MWILVGLWVVAAAGLGGSVWITSGQKAVAEDLARATETVAEAVSSQRWSDARREIGELRRRWKEVRKVWALNTEHEHMDAISDDFVEAEAGIDLQDPAALIPLRRARERILDLPDRDWLTLENLF